MFKKVLNKKLLIISSLAITIFIFSIGAFANNPNQDDKLKIVEELKIKKNKIESEVENDMSKEKKEENSKILKSVSEQISISEIEAGTYDYKQEIQIAINTLTVSIDDYKNIISKAILDPEDKKIMDKRFEELEKIRDKYIKLFEEKNGPSDEKLLRNLRDDIDIVLKAYAPKKTNENKQ